MLPERDLALLRDMCDQADLGIAIVSDRSRGELTSDPVLRLALERIITVLGEAATQVSEGTRTSLVTLPWRQMTAMRNRLVHSYSSVDHDIVWATVTVDFPGLAAELRRILADHTGPSGGDT